jgi:hypothetical protein
MLIVRCLIVVPSYFLAAFPLLLELSVLCFLSPSRILKAFSQSAANMNKLESSDILQAASASASARSHHAAQGPSPLAAKALSTDQS